MAVNKKKNIILPIVAALVIIVAAVSIVVPKLTKDSSETDASVQDTSQSQSAAVNTSSEDIVIDESTVTETASFYDYDADGTTVEVFAVKASDGTIRIALNTCQVCNGSPYAYFVQQGDSFICQNCMNSFDRDDIGLVHGGCNPTPVTEDNYQIENGKIIIPAEFLEQYKDNFSNWKNF